MENDARVALKKAVANADSGHYSISDDALMLSALAIVDAIRDLTKQVKRLADLHGKYETYT